MESITFDLSVVQGGAAATLTFDPVLVQVEGRSLSLSTCLGLQVDECHRFRPVLVRGGAAARSLSTSSCRRGIDRVAGRLEGGNFYISDRASSIQNGNVDQYIVMTMKR